MALPGQTHRQGTAGHIARDGGSIKTHGRRLPRGLFRDRAGSGEARRMKPPEPWRDETRGAGKSPGVLREGATATGRRAETGLAANVGDDAPQPPHLDGSANGVEGFTQLVCGSAGLDSRQVDRPSKLS